MKIGADASAAAGPKGRDASADTDAFLRSEILSYSRSRGLFHAGISLEGSTLRADNDANESIYQQKISAREIVLDGKVAVPPSGQMLVNTLQRNAPHNESDKASNQ